MTAQRSLEAELRHNQERYALVAEAANEGLYDWDVETQELYVSPRLNEMFDFGEGPLDSHRWFARVHPDDRDNYRRALVTHFKGRPGAWKSNTASRSRAANCAGCSTPASPSATGPAGLCA